MSFLTHANFIATTVNTPPSPAAPSAGATSTFTVATGTSAIFPAVPFNCIVYTAGIFPNYLNTEIVKVTAINTGTDTLTVTRGAESSNVQTIVNGNIISMTITAQNLTDIESAVTANTASIVTNTTNIGINSGDITSNITNIGINTTNIATLTTELSTLTTTVDAIPVLSDITDNTSTHKIGVSQSSPQYALDVTGDINFTGTLRQNGTPFSAGGSGNVTAGNYGGGVPPFTPSGPMIAFDDSTGQQWNFFNGSWH